MPRDTFTELSNPTMESGSESAYYFQNSTFDEGESDLDMPSFIDTNIDCIDPMLIMMIRQGDMDAALEHVRSMRESTEQIVTQRCIEQRWKHEDEVKEQKSSGGKFARMQQRIKLLKAQKGAQVK